MTQQVFARIAGTGSYLPEKVLTNDDLAKFVDTSDEWIAARTGIRERHIAAEGETTSDLAYHAAMRALEAAGVDAKELDLIVVGTTTPDLIFPSTACLLQHQHRRRWLPRVRRQRRLLGLSSTRSPWPTSSSVPARRRPRSWLAPKP